MTYFGMDKPTLSLALSGFTSEFEMGSGGTHLLKSPGNILGRKSFVFLRFRISPLPAFVSVSCVVLCVR